MSENPLFTSFSVPYFSALDINVTHSTWGVWGEHVDTFHLLRLVAAGGERLQIPGQGGRLAGDVDQTGRPDGSQFLQCLRVDTAAGRVEDDKAGLFL